MILKQALENIDLKKQKKSYIINLLMQFVNEIDSTGSIDKEDLKQAKDIIKSMQDDIKGLNSLINELTKRVEKLEENV